MKLRFRKYTVLLLLIVAGLKTELTAALPVNVRIFTTNIISTFIFSPAEGSYSIYGDGVFLMDCDATGIFQIGIEKDSIHLKTFENDIGNYATIKFVSKPEHAAFKIKCVFPLSLVRTYDDDLEVRLMPDKTQLLLINKVGLESYIAGVVQSESGKTNNREYYKMQAILCRTYLLANLNRHITEGFQVCDDVHCQVYLSRATENKVKDAVLTTQGLVIVDSDLNLITAAFHSNCGGETCNSEDVWAISTTYLKAVKDTFCIHKTNAYWERSIPLIDWQVYLKSKGKKENDSFSKPFNTNNFNQQSGRAIYYVDGSFKLPLKTIRADFKLKSTYFSVTPKGNNIVFKGRGYGHGVGLCQEGAMQMSKSNYTYIDILHHYYKGIIVVDLTSLNYFKQE